MLILHTLVPSFSCWLFGGPETTTEDINFTKMSLGEEEGGGGGGGGGHAPRLPRKSMLRTFINHHVGGKTGLDRFISCFHKTTFMNTL